MRATKSRGFALLLILVVLVVTGTALVLALGPWSGAARQTDERDRQRALSDARSTLIGYALLATATDGTRRPGALPCPDLFDPDDPDDESYGIANSLDCINSNGAVMLGRLPHRTLGMERGEHDLWLAIDLALHNESGNFINPEGGLEGGLRINGEGGHAAVLLAPGDPLPGQTGRPSADPGKYLEHENAVADPNFLDCRDRADCNDRAVGLSLDRLFAPVQLRVLAALEVALADFYAVHGHLPRPAPLDAANTICDPGLERGTLPLLEPPPEDDACEDYERLEQESLPDWLVQQGWVDETGTGPSFIVYHVAPGCTIDGGGECADGPLTLAGEASLGAMLVGAGRALAGQDRSQSVVLADYLEPPNAEAGEAYSRSAVEHSARNDVFRGVQIP